MIFKYSLSFKLNIYQKKNILYHSCFKLINLITLMEHHWSLDYPHRNLVITLLFHLQSISYRICFHFHYNAYQNDYWDLLFHLNSILIFNHSWISKLGWIAVCMLEILMDYSVFLLYFHFLIFFMRIFYVLFENLLWIKLVDSEVVNSI